MHFKCILKIVFWLLQVTSTMGCGPKTQSQAVFKLHSDSQFEYFKVAVDSGVRMVSGATSRACRKYGLVAACYGPSGCHRNDETECQVVPLENECGRPMRGLSKAVCDGEINAQKCAELEGVFQYYKGYDGGDNGVLELGLGGRLVNGKHYTSGEWGMKFFAYCVKGLKLHSDSKFDYYKVAVDSGVRMVEGATSTACRKVGMEAACPGRSGCLWNDETKCQVVPIETGCGWPMLGISQVTSMEGISQAVCDGEIYAWKCTKLAGVFQYMKGWHGGDWGLVCAGQGRANRAVDGNDHTSGDGGEILYAYCVKGR